MRLAISCGYAGMGLGNDTLDLVQEAERLGYAQAWVAEAYGSDAPTMLGWLAGQTTTIGLGAGVMQIPARTPAMTAMTAATLDTLSDGRFHLGLGVSGPQVSEGWHGVRFAAPLARTREYVEIVRMALRREQVAYAGRPLHPAAARRARARRCGSPSGPRAADLPVYLAAVGPRNLRLAGEVADGWLGIFFSPEHSADQLGAVRAGREAVGAGDDGDPMAGFDVVATVPVVVTDDLEAARAALAGYTALYIGGMGSREQNFYNALARRIGFDEAADEIQDLYLAGRPRDAADAVPFDLVDSTALIGPPGADRRADRSVRRCRGHHALGRAVRADHAGPGGGAAHRGARRWRRWPEGCGGAPRLSARARRTHLSPGRHPRRRRRTHRVPPDQLDRAPHDHRAAARAAGRRPRDHGLHRDHPDRRDHRDVHLLRRQDRPPVPGLGQRADPRHRRGREDPDYTLAWAVIVGSLPVGIVGFLARDLISGALRSLWVVAVALILWSAVIWVAEQRHDVLEKRGIQRDEHDITVKDGLVIGLVQVLLAHPRACPGPARPSRPA